MIYPVLVLLKPGRVRWGPECWQRVGFVYLYSSFFGHVGACGPLLSSQLRREKTPRARGGVTMAAPLQLRLEPTEVV
eukprot:scaffold268_cov134-Isochrysis_galbana.AAC.2